MTKTIRNGGEYSRGVNIVNFVKQIRCYWKSFAMFGLHCKCKVPKKGFFGSPTFTMFTGGINGRNNT
jgi:hypothetical protein